MTWEVFVNGPHQVLAELRNSLPAPDVTVIADGDLTNVDVLEDLIPQLGDVAIDDGRGN
jgi:hypothetical protein